LWAALRPVTALLSGHTASLLFCLRNEVTIAFSTHGLSGAFGATLRYEMRIDQDAWDRRDLTIIPPSWSKFSIEL